jgi:hypothetical protein
MKSYYNLARAIRILDVKLSVALERGDRKASDYGYARDRLLDLAKAQDDNSSVIDWMTESYQWHHERSKVEQSKIHMGASMAFCRCLKAVQTGRPGFLPIGFELRRIILFRKFGRVT